MFDIYLVSLNQTIYRCKIRSVIMGPDLIENMLCLPVAVWRFMIVEVVVGVGLVATL